MRALISWVAHVWPRLFRPMSLSQTGRERTYVPRVMCSPGHVSPAVCMGAVNTGPYRGLLKCAHFPDPIEAAQMRSLAQIPNNSAFQMVRTRVRVHTGGTALKPGIWCGVKRSETTFSTGLGALHLVRTRERLSRSHQRKQTELRAFGSNGTFSPHQLMSV